MTQKLIRIFLISLVRFYQISLSPYLGKNCRFTPTCSGYAIEAFEKLPIHQAIWYSFKRILKCHPLHKGGFDPLIDDQYSQCEEDFNKDKGVFNGI